MEGVALRTASCAAICCTPGTVHSRAAVGSSCQVAGAPVCYRLPAKSTRQSALIASFEGLRSNSRVSLENAPFGRGSNSFRGFRPTHTSTQRESRFSGAQCAATQDQPVSQQREGSLFGREKEYSGAESLVRNLPAPARYLACAAIIAGAIATGYAVGARVKPPVGQIAGAVALGAAGAGAAHVLNTSSKEVAAKEVYNALVRHPDPDALKYEEVEAVAKKYGASLEDERVTDELKDIYCQYILGVLPQGNEPLKGHEVESIVQFKDALRLEDDDAASVHIEVGRRIFRQRMEAGDKDSSVAERRTFTKLVYVSNLVFGEKSRFLLPWKRIFKVTDSQIEVAIQDNAKRLLQTAVDESDAEPEVGKLRELRNLQLKYKVSDEVAEEMFREKARRRAEAYITRSLEVLKARTRVKDIPRALGELEGLMAYNKTMSSLSQESDLIPGVSAVSVAGGEFDGDRQMDDLKLLYRTYLGEALTGDQLQDSKVEGLARLRNIFGMGRKEAEAVEVEVTGKVYRRKLGQAVSSGALDAAESKAAFLEDLCDRLRFDPEEAFRIHEEIYRQKLEQCLDDKQLDDDDVKALQRLRVLLCIPQKTVDAAHTEVCGRIFEKVVDDAISAGVDGYDPDMQKAVQDAVKGLRLPLKAAMDIAAKTVKSVFLTFAKRAKSSMSRTESGRELKKMVIFSNLTVSLLLDDIRRGIDPSSAEPSEEEKAAEEAKKKEEEERLKREQAMMEEEEMEMLQSMYKTKGAAKEGKAQKEVTIKDELELRDRTDLYEKFLMYAIQGETTGMPMGTTITVQRDNSDFVRLSQLGDILGLSQYEVAMVHQGLAEKAFKTQAQTVLADGQLSKARMEQLKEIQKSLGLPDAPAQKVIQSITSTKMAGAIDQAVQQGRLTVEDIRSLKESGVDIQTMVAKPVRLQLFRKLVTKAFTAGTGEFDEEQLYEKLPVDLGLDPEAMRTVVTEAAKERLKDSLVQSVALLRQKQTARVVSELKNLLACDKADPQPEALSWPVKEELLDLYGLYLAETERKEDETKRLRELLAIDDRTAAMLEDMVEAGGFSLEAKEEDFVF